MDWVKLSTHVISHERFLLAGPVARDLWSWGLLYCGLHETDGDIPMIAVLTSPWGAGGKANVKTAEKLVAVGLWERTDQGYRCLRWESQGNATKAQLEAARAATRDRVKRHRNAVTPPVTNGVTNGVSNAFVPNSNSLSTSGSGSLDLASPPGWWGAACDAAAMAVGGEVGDRPARWAEYAAARARKGWAMDHTDAVGWLSTVVRTERRNARTPAARGAEATKQPYDPAAPWLKLPEVG